MELNKFTDIIKKNIENREEATACADRFYEMLGMDPGCEIMNLPQVIGSLFLDNHFLTIQLPMKDKEIGALCYKGNYKGGYVFINSSLPPFNVNFALCHEVCHVCVNDDINRNTAEVYVSSTYLDHKEERIANQFAGMILMPERHFRRMYEKFSSEEITGGEKKAVVICKLMSYFHAPYMAVLIRLQELELLHDKEDLPYLLSISSADVERIFRQLWLDVSALEPIYRDDYARLHDLVQSIGKDNVEQEMQYESDYLESLRNLDNLYRRIKEDF